MALVRHFEHKDMNRNRLHDEVEATYSVFESDGRPILQVNSYGRTDREMPGIASQTIQLDDEGARALFDIIKREFHLA